MNIQFNTFSNHSCDQIQLEDSYKKFIETVYSSEIGFYTLTDEKKLITQTLEILEEIKHKKYFIQIGIGGSALGPQMLISSLAKDKNKSFYLLDNIDADYIENQLQKVDLSESIFYVVSKSGGTAETIACYSIIRNLLLSEGVSEDELKNYFIFCTDPHSGQLRQHVNKNNYFSLEVPTNIGGRFSVLTPVGLLPAAFMGIDIQSLYSGANEAKVIIENKDLLNNVFLKTAFEILALQHECTDTVMMPYSSKLRDFSFWFVQLWAESLGKFCEKRNSPVGLTPIPAYGATDQHSQMQLFMEGPNNKLLFLIYIKKRANNYSLNSNLELDSANKLSNFSLNDLIEAEYNGTLTALKENKRNVIALEIEQLDEKSLGGLILFFESLTCLIGLELKIDPFNQPGVEKGKKYAFDYLNSLRK